MSENKRFTISVPQLPDESFVTNRRIYLFCAVFMKSVNREMKDAEIFIILITYHAHST